MRQGAFKILKKVISLLYFISLQSYKEYIKNILKEC